MLKQLALCILAAFSLSLVGCAGVYQQDSAADDPGSEEESAGETGSRTSKKHQTRELWQRKMVALTFDDGPSGATERLLDELQKRSVKATFFLLGENMEKRQALVTRMIEDGHNVGCHSYSHTVSRNSSYEFVTGDFDRCEDVLVSIAPDYSFRLLRTPGGQISDVFVKAAIERDWRIIGWSNGNFNDKLPTAQEVADSTFEGTYGIRNGEIILIHDRSDKEVDAAVILMDRLIAEGYDLVNMSELLERRNGGKAGEHYHLPIY